MATISSQEFFSKGPVKVVGNEVTQKEELQDNGLRRVADIYGKNLKESFMGGLERGAESFDQAGKYEEAVRSRDLSGMGIAAARGGLRLAGGVAQAMFSPVTAAVQTAAQGYSELDQATGGRVADKIKSIAEKNPEVVQGVSEWITQNPEKVKDAEDILNFIGAKIAPKASSALKETVEVGTDIVGGAADAGVGVLKTTVGKLTPDAEAIMQRVARIPKGKQASFEQMTGDSVGGYLDKRGIYGDTEEITQKLYDRFQTSKQTADDALAQLQGTYRASPVRTALTELEGKVERTSSPGAPDSDLRRVKELIAKERSEGLTMTEINEVKRMYERRVRLDYLKTNAPEDVARATNVDNALREWQMTEADKAGLTNLKEINKETQASKYLLDAIGKENAGMAGNNAVGLTDWIVLSGGDPTAISAFLVKKGFSNKDIQSWFAKNLSKYPEKIGVPEAKFKEKLQLEAPAEGAPKSSVNVPINMEAVSQSYLDKELVKRFGKNYTPAQVEQFLLESGIGKEVFNTRPVNAMTAEGRTQSQADLNLESMNAKRAKLPAQEISQQSYPNSTPKTFEELVDNANKYQPQFEKSVTSIAKNLGFDAKVGNPKLLRTFEDKKLRPGEENFTIKDARDANRATILVSSEKDLSKVEQEIAKQFEVSRVKNKFGNDYAYKSAIINVKTPAGHEAEIAITTPKMWGAKITEGDALYRVVRSGAKGWEEAEKKMLELYKRAN